jgi:hypothetical protein
MCDVKRHAKGGWDLFCYNAGWNQWELTRMWIAAWDLFVTAFSKSGAQDAKLPGTKWGGGGNIYPCRFTYLLWSGSGRNSRFNGYAVTESR